MNVYYKYSNYFTAYLLMRNLFSTFKSDFCNKCDLYDFSPSK